MDPRSGRSALSVARRQQMMQLRRDADRYDEEAREDRNAMWIAGGATVGLTAAGLLALHLKSKKNARIAAEAKSQRDTEASALAEPASAAKRAERATKGARKAQEVLDAVQAECDRRQQAHDAAAATAAEASGDAQTRAEALKSATEARAIAQLEEANAKTDRTRAWIARRNAATAAANPAADAAEAADKIADKAADKKIADLVIVEAQASNATKEATAKTARKALKALGKWTEARRTANSAKLAADVARNTADAASLAMDLKAKKAQELAGSEVEATRAEAAVTAAQDARAKSIKGAGAKGPNEGTAEQIGRAVAAAEAETQRLTQAAAKAEERANEAGENVAQAKKAAHDAAEAASAATSEADAAEAQANIAQIAAHTARLNALNASNASFHDALETQAAQEAHALTASFGFAGRPFTRAARGRLASYV